MCVFFLLSLSLCVIVVVVVDVEPLQSIRFSLFFGFVLFFSCGLGFVVLSSENSNHSTSAKVFCSRNHSGCRIFRFCHIWRQYTEETNTLDRLCFSLFGIVRVLPLPTTFLYTRSLYFGRFGMLAFAFVFISKKEWKREGARHNFGRVLWPYAVVYYFDKFNYVKVCKHSNRLLQMLSPFQHSLSPSLFLCMHVSIYRFMCIVQCTMHSACVRNAAVRSLITGNMKITNVHTARTLMHCLHSTTIQPNPQNILLILIHQHVYFLRFWFCHCHCFCCV